METMCIVPSKPPLFTPNKKLNDDHHASDQTMNHDDTHLKDNQHEQQQQKPRRVKTTNSITIHPNDVLGGRGNGVAAHPGNQLFRNVCMRHQQDYQRAKRREKMAISKLVIHQITSQSPPGRFLEKNRGEMWKVMDPKRVLEKTSQALRDRSSNTGSGTTSPSTSKLSSPSRTKSIAINVPVDSLAALQQQQPQEPAAPSDGRLGLEYHHPRHGGTIAQSHLYRQDTESTLPLPLPPFTMNHRPQQAYRHHHHSVAAASSDPHHHQSHLIAARIPPQFSLHNTNNNNNNDTTSSTLKLLLAARAILSTQEDEEREHLDQFCDAEEENAFHGNTSLEIHYLAYRRGNLL